MLDGMPAAYLKDPTNSQSADYFSGVPLGFVSQDGLPYIYNHLDFRIEVQPTDQDSFNIVGFSVTPYSVDFAAQKDKENKKTDRTNLDDIAKLLEQQGQGQGEGSHEKLISATGQLLKPGQMNQF